MKTTTDGSPPLFTRRAYLTWQAVLGGCPWILATEAVASTALEHPEWDMEEKATWAEWEGR